MVQNAHPGRSFHLLTYNIQSGSGASCYHHYFTKGWKQLLPNREQMRNLNAIAKILKPYDFVGLQEVDGGSFRSGFVNQTRYLAMRSGFNFWFSQPNRNVGNLAKHSNGLLSRYSPSLCQHLKLPGMPGRGILLSEFGYGQETLAVIVVHLALGGRSQRRQIAFINELASQYPYVIILGDFNLSEDRREMRELKSHGFLDACMGDPTFPSWRPNRKIDYILVSDNLKVSSSSIVDYHLSDHLPIQLKVQLPATIALTSNEKHVVNGL
ncbi:MAG: endonuclease/exonuclease/phosphatase family protein [Gammaproteobacteria bacterium]|jgi:endonuclease/exonuclease/phosphatase family metal-dependent hydrolase